MGVPVTLIHGVLITLIVLVLIVAVQAVGVLLWIGFLVLPAATLLPFAKSLRSLAVGPAFLGCLVPPAALLAAYWLDLPPGPTIIVCMACIAVGAQLSQIFSRPRGYRHRHAKQSAQTLSS